MMYDETILKLLDQGLTAYGLGNLDEALSAWQRVLELDPTNTRARDYIIFIERHWAPAPVAEPQSPPPKNMPAVAVSPPPEYNRPSKSILQSAHWGDIYDGTTAETSIQPSRTQPQSIQPQPIQPQPILSPPILSQPIHSPPIQPSRTQPQPLLAPVATPQAEILTSTLPPKPAIPSSATPFSAAPFSAASFSAAPLSTAFNAVPFPTVQNAVPFSTVQNAPDIGSALDLVVADMTPEPIKSNQNTQSGEPLLKSAQDRMALQDFSGALELLEVLLAEKPDHELANQMRTEAQQRLTDMLFSKLGNLDRVPKVCMRGDEIIWLNLDHRAGFVLSLVDGTISFDEILLICGLSQLEGTRILVQLLQNNVITAD